MTKTIAPPIHIPGFEPCIPNMENKEIQKRLKAIGLIEDALGIVYGSPASAKALLKEALDVLRK